MITEIEEIESKSRKKKPQDEEELGLFNNLIKFFKKEPDKKEKDSSAFKETPKVDVPLNEPASNRLQNRAEIISDITSAIIANNEQAKDVTTSPTNNLNTSNQTNSPITSTLYYNNPDIANFDYSNLTLGFSGITGNNIVGELIANFAKKMSGLREVGGENSVPELDRMINNLGIKGLGGDVAWCAKLTSVAAGFAAQELDKLFATGGKISKIFPEGASVLNIAEHFKNNKSLISPSEVKGINPHDLVGTQLLLSRGNGGHTGIVTGYDEKTGIMTVLEGNLGNEGKSAEIKYNLANLISKGGTTNSDGSYKTKLIGFGDYNSLIKNADSELFASLQKDNTMLAQNYTSTKITKTIS